MKEFDSAHWAQAWPYPRPDLPPVARPGEAEHTVSVWLLPKFSMLTLFCLLEPLRVANRFGRTRSFGTCSICRRDCPFSCV